MTTSFYSEEELKTIGLKSYGQMVKISRYARIYSPEKISVGDNVRIDDFCILSGDITIGSNIHISAYVALYGTKGIIMEDYSGISPRSTVFSAMDDFGGDFLIGPIHQDVQTNVQGGPVILKKYSQIGASCVVFPNLIINEGAVVGAFSLVTHSISPWEVHVGIPAKFHKSRNRGLVNLI